MLEILRNACVGLASLLFTPAMAAPSGESSDLQRRLTSPMLFSSEVNRNEFFREQYKLVRLWPFVSKDDVTEELMVGQQVEYTTRGVVPRYCGTHSYAYFSDGGMIEADETTLITQSLLKLKPSSFRSKMKSLNRIWQKGAELFPNLVPSAPDPLAASDKPESKNEIYKLYQEQINLSTSLVQVKESTNGNVQMDSSDYSIGGWFKPSSLSKGESMNLLSKFYTDQSGHEIRPEWKVFFSGNVIYFQSFRDGFLNTESKYLNSNEAFDFRQKNSNLYGRYDYFDDVTERIASDKASVANTTSLSVIPKYFLPPIVPMAKGDVNKPVPVPPLPPGHRPPELPFPPNFPTPPSGPIPRPLPPTGIIGGGGQILKIHSADIDLKNFWWATTLGQCYDCVGSGTHSDIWHYITVSVHLHDPLGPYLDFWIIQDPNPHFFGNSPTIKSNAKHLRIEMGRSENSFPALNPFANAEELHQNCTPQSEFDPCIHSILQIGSIEKSNAYSGFMRGVFLSKKALSEYEAFDLASQFYPDDSVTACTYEPIPKPR